MVNVGGIAPESEWFIAGVGVMAKFKFDGKVVVSEIAFDKGANRGGLAAAAVNDAEGLLFEGEADDFVRNAGDVVEVADLLAAGHFKGGLAAGDGACELRQERLGRLAGSVKVKKAVPDEVKGVVGLLQLEVVTERVFGDGVGGGGFGDHGFCFQTAGGAVFQAGSCHGKSAESAGN